MVEYACRQGELRLPEPREVEQAVEEIMQLINLDERDGGVTFSLRFGDQWGQPWYAVGLENYWTRRPRPKDLPTIARWFMQQHYELLSHPRCCLGIWTPGDVDDRNAYLDISVIILNADVALSFGRDGNQEAIFDLLGKIPIEEIGGNGGPIWSEEPSDKQLRDHAEERIAQLEQDDPINEEKVQFRLGRNS